MANGIITGPPQVDFYKMLGGMGDTLQANQKRALQREAFASDPNSSGGVDFHKALATFVRAGDLDSAAKAAAMQKALSPESTSDIQNFNYAAKNPEFLPFLKQQAEAKSTKINNATTVNNVGEKAYDTTVGKDYGEAFVGFQKAGRDATKAIGTLNLMEGLTKDPNFYSGFGGDAALRANQALVTLGVKDPKATSATETFRALGNQTVLDAAGGSLGNQISNGDRDYINATTANLSNSPDGNRQLIDMRRKLAMRQQEVAKLARDYARRNGGRIDAGFDEFLADYAEKNPLFPRSQSAPKALGQPSVDDINAEIQRRGLR
jgi:hypothetical protein